MSEIPESDWKLFRQMYPQALERFCRRTLEDIETIAADGEKSCHQRYLAIYADTQRKDQELARLFDNPRRSTAVMQIMSMFANGLFTGEELTQFSDSTKKHIRMFCER